MLVASIGGLQLYAGDEARVERGKSEFGRLQNKRSEYEMKYEEGRETITVTSAFMRAGEGGNLGYGMTCFG